MHDERKNSKWLEPKEISMLMNKNIIQGITENLISQLKDLKTSEVNETCPIGIVSMDNWEWPQGVALFAMYSYYKESGDKEILDYLVDWFDRKLIEGLPYKNINTMCPMLTLAYLYDETKKQNYLSAIKEWAEYALKELPRTEEGGLQHCVSGHLNEGQIWDDTLYMTVLFISKAGLLLNDVTYLQESIRQFLVHIKYLTDNSTGLLFHGWSFIGRHNFGKALWGRGNSWYTAGLVDYIEMTDIPDGVRMFLLSTLEQQVKKLAELQHDSGLWHTLLDDPDSYLETSCSAAFAYGILKATRMGYIDKKYLETGMNAFRAVVEQIDKTGEVQGVSYGTPVFQNKSDYKEIEICPMPYGQSMALMMLVEGLKHL